MVNGELWTFPPTALSGVIRTGCLMAGWVWGAQRVRSGKQSKKPQGAPLNNAQDFTKCSILQKRLEAGWQKVGFLKAAGPAGPGQRLSGVLGERAGLSEAPLCSGQMQASIQACRQSSRSKGWGLGLHGTRGFGAYLDCPRVPSLLVVN